MSRQNPRRPASSRAPVGRPRRVAGQGRATSAPPTEAPPTEPVEIPAAETQTPSALIEPVEIPAAKAPADTPPDDRPGSTALFDSRRATVVLAVLAAVLAVVAGGLFAWDAWRGDDEPAAANTHPVVMNSDDVTDGVAAAAKAAETIVGTSYQDYDKQVDEAAALMTDGFAKQYRQTAEDTKADVVDAKTVIDARVVAQGVVRASRSEVEALVFLNQYVSKDGGDTTYTPYRALVTVVHTDRGWLVSNIDTQ
jgi:Mce-associated membrane protein